MASDKADIPVPALPAALTVDTVIRLGFFGLLAYWALNVVGPFLTILLWSAIITVALYPMFDWLSLHLRSRKLAAVLIAVPCLLVVIGPVAWLGLGLVGSVTSFIKTLDAGLLSFPGPAESIKAWPLIGEKMYELWAYAAANTKAVLVDIAPKLRPVGTKVLDLAENFGTGLFQFIVAIVIAGFLLSPGPKLIDSLRAVLRRILSDRGEEVMQLAASTVRNVSRGIVGVALLQSALGGAGLLMIGVPAAGLLTFFALLLGLIQVGPAIIFLPTIIWCWVTKDTMTAIIFTTYMVPVGLVDNVLRPLVMSRGLSTPMPVIVIGVFGGMIAFGLIGLFLGPIVLSVAWVLIRVWLRESEGMTRGVFDVSSKDR